LLKLVLDIDWEEFVAEAFESYWVVGLYCNMRFVDQSTDPVFMNMRFEQRNLASYLLFAPGLSRRSMSTLLYGCGVGFGAVHGYVYLL
jgi:hypothetical protein